MKDHEIAQVINDITHVARVYGQTQQIRERIREVLFPVLDSGKQKRKPLSGAELDELWKASYKEHDDGEKALQNRKRRLKRFARAIEKAHEIGD